MQHNSLGGHIVIPSKSPSVIPIVAPVNGEQQREILEQKPKVVLKPPLKGSLNGKRLCRNVIIHGYCKYEGKGCEFNHDSNKPTSPTTSPESKTKGLVRGSQSPAAVSFQTVSVDSVNAPEFVPRFTMDVGPTSPAAKEIKSIDFTPIETNKYQTETNHLASLTNSFSQFSVDKQPTSPPQMMQQSQDPYYYMNQQSIYPRQPLQHHLYAGPLPHTSSKLQPHQRAMKDFFLSEDLRESLLQRNEAQLTTARDVGLPLEVHVYHSLYPLDSSTKSYFGHATSIYKAVCSVDGRTYALLRVEGYRLVNEVAIAAVETWRRLRHCNIVSVREAFTSRAFGDNSLIFVFDYHPCSTTLYQSYFANPSSAVISEAVLWSYITQLASALKAIHGSGLACRTLDPTKILITGKNRIRINGVSVLDVTQYDSTNVAVFQQEDLLALGKVVMALTSHSLHTDLNAGFERLENYYSQDVKQLVMYLLSKPQSTKSIDELLGLMAPRILQEINCAQLYNDELESELSKELENGRLVRLMSKMGFINERPEFDMDPSWSETGDRYLIKLFRDYVFHQVDENGRPVVDMVHVLTCLNKLDAGVEEKIMLMSRDEQSCLIVSFKEIKNCILSAFNDLTSGRK